MLIDRTTLTDLEVFGTRIGEGGLVTLLDRTRTRIGRAALRRRIAAPMSNLEALRSTQQAVEWLGRLDVPIRLESRAIEAAASFLDSRIVIARRGGALIWVDEVVMRVRYRDAVREIRSGLESIETLLHVARRVVKSLSAADAPPLLLELSSALGEMIRCGEGALGSRSLLRADRLIRGHGMETMREGIATLGEVEALQSLATSTSLPGWSQPEFVESPDFLLEAEAAFHPLLPGATPNPVRLGRDDPLVFLTGPNMAGKTTYLRTVALLVVLAQMGARVPARNVRLAPVEALLTSLSPTDDLSAGVSFFVAEINRVKEAASLVASGRRALVLFDEVFKGTNVKDALEATTLVIQGFARAPRTGSIFSSHLSGLAGVLGDNAAIRLRRFDGDVVDGSPSFSYRLESGVSDRRVGMLLLEQAEVPELLKRMVDQGGRGSPPDEGRNTQESG